MINEHIKNLTIIGNSIVLILRLISIRPRGFHVILPKNHRTLEKIEQHPLIISSFTCISICNVTIETIFFLCVYQICILWFCFLSEHFYPVSVSCFKKIKFMLLAVIYYWENDEIRKSITGLPDNIVKERFLSITKDFLKITVLLFLPLLLLLS